MMFDSSPLYSATTIEKADRSLVAEVKQSGNYTTTMRLSRLCCLLLVLGLRCRQIESFVVRHKRMPLCHIGKSVQFIDSSHHLKTSTALLGFRSELRRRFRARFFRDKTTLPKKDDWTEAATVHFLDESSTTSSTKPAASSLRASEDENDLPIIVGSDQRQGSVESGAAMSTTRRENVVLHRRHLKTLPLTSSATLTRAKTAASTTHLSLYSLPRSNRNLTLLETEFRDMIEYFANYSEADLLSIADPRKRALFEGVAASSYDPPIYRAFEILFEDLLPLRLAGRVIFGKLKQFMSASIELRKDEIERVVDRTGLVDDTKQIEEIRLMFVSTASNLNGDSWLTLNQLAETGIITTTATEVLGFESSERLLREFDTDNSGRLTFLDLMSGLWECANTMCGIDYCNPQVVLHNLLIELNEYPPSPADFNANLDKRRRQYSARYDEMVSSFIMWQHILPPPAVDGRAEGRRMEVVRGCFVGAKNQKVVDALRIVYVDYAGLRLAGDIIFKLVSTILKRR